MEGQRDEQRRETGEGKERKTRGKPDRLCFRVKREKKETRENFPLSQTQEVIIRDQ